jgi:membrane-associated phospholipid phosphatase
MKNKHNPNSKNILQSWILWAAIAVAGIAASFLFDRPVLALMSWAKNPLFDSIFGWFTSSLSIIIIMLVMTSFFMWETKKREWIIPLWLSAAVTMFIVYSLKLIVMRDRPNELVMTFLWMKDFSFPSAHAAICFTLLPILDRIYSRFRLFWIFFAVMVALSRLYFQVHYFSDVVAGGALGYLIGYLVCGSYLKIARGRGWKSAN